jgi:hypothetical protein
MRIMAGCAVTIVHRGVNRFARLNFTIHRRMTNGTGCPLVLFHTERIGIYFCLVTERTLSLSNGAVEELFYPGSKLLVTLIRRAGRRTVVKEYAVPTQLQNMRRKAAIPVIYDGSRLFIYHVASSPPVKRVRA